MNKRLAWSSLNYLTQNPNSIYLLGYRIIMDYTKLRQDLLTAMNRVQAGFGDRPDIVAAAAATVLSRILPLPDSQVEDVRRFLLGHHVEEINRTISLINEITVINTQYAKSLTIGFYSMRYNTAFPTDLTAEGLEYGFIDAYVGADKYLAWDDVCKLNKYKAAIVEILPKVKALMEM